MADSFLIVIALPLVINLFRAYLIYMWSDEGVMLCVVMVRSIVDVAPRLSNVVVPRVLTSAKFGVIQHDTTHIPSYCDHAPAAFIVHNGYVLDDNVFIIVIVLVLVPYNFVCVTFDLF